MKIPLALHRLVHAAERLVDRPRGAWRRRRGDFSIVPYRGFAGARRALLWGRVLRARRYRETSATDPWWRNAATMLKRFATREVPGVELTVELDSQTRVTRTDGEGYFEVELLLPRPLAPGWRRARARLAQTAETRSLPLHVIDPAAEFAVVSDVDDTVLRSGATRTLRLVGTTMTGNARTRLPFAGVAALYRALAGGSSGRGSNPFFYVSSSPWNLYDFLLEFLELHGLPPGPLLLRDLGIDRQRFLIGSHDEHKLRQIGRVLDTCGALPFVLVGDSGQRDPEIYAKAVRQHPGRVVAIYIRDVGGGERGARVVEIAADLGRQQGVPMVLVPDSGAALAHARGLGLAARSL